MTTLMEIQNVSPPTDDLHLAKRSREDSAAFAELYRRYVTNVYRYHLSHTGNVKDAEDLTSQTFMVALEGIRSFRASGSFVAWLMGIASRKKAMFFRSKKFEIGLDNARHIPAPGLPTDKEAFLRLKAEAISRALNQLSADRSEAIALTFFGGLTNEEAGSAMGKSESAVKMLISRGLQDLRERSALRTEEAES